MRGKLAKWGNSLALRVPRGCVAQLKVADGQAVEVTVERGRLVVTPVKPSYRLKDLLANTTPAAMRAFDWAEGADGEAANG